MAVINEPLWELSWQYDPIVRALADRHYSRLTIGARGFTGSGRPLVLRGIDHLSGWVSFWQPRPTHQWKKSWNNSLFRNESPHKASILIQQAVAITRGIWGEPPEEGFITFVDPKKVREKKDPGHCYIIAGWRFAGLTTRKLMCFQLLPEDFPEPMKLPYFSDLKK